MSKKKTSDKLVYFDNNGTTDINEKVIDLMVKWLHDSQNPSSTSSIAKKSRDLILDVNKQMLDHCSARNKYECIFTSGATESNCTIIRIACMAYLRQMRVKPTVVISGIEHESVIACCKSMEFDNLANICYVMPNYEGFISTNSIEEALNTSPNVALVCVMYANNELGTINNIREIGALVQSRGIPLHVDAVQMFGKYQINLANNNITTMSMSFHKLFGPKGIGLLYIHKQLIDGYNLSGLLNGIQQNGLRGGTENVPAIAGAGLSLSLAFRDRAEKNEKLHGLRQYLIDKLSKLYPVGDYLKYLKHALHNEVDKYNLDYDYQEEEIDGEIIIKPFNDVEIVFLGPTNKDRVIPNTLLFSLAKNVSDSYGTFCNTKLKERLDDMGIVVSVGSTCLSVSKDASHVMRAIQAPPVIRRGVIRVSMCEKNNRDDIDYFVKCYEACVAEQVAPVKKRNEKARPLASKMSASKPRTSAASKQTAQASKNLGASRSSVDHRSRVPSTNAKKNANKIDRLNDKLDSLVPNNNLFAKVDD